MPEAHPGTAASYRLSAAQRQWLLHRVAGYFRLAEERLRLRLPRYQVRFDLRGQAAGQCCGGSRSLRFNEAIAAKYWQQMDATIAHEVAHAVVFEMHRGRRRRLRPHGPEWTGMMRLFGHEPARCHNFEPNDIPVRRRPAIISNAPAGNSHCRQPDTSG